MMEFRQFYLGCLAHASYLIGSDGEAAIVDPQRDVDIYLEAAQQSGLAIRWVIETHLHADFVSGHRELAERTGAQIVFGARAGATFPHRAVSDGDEIRVGQVVLRVLETPGHTPEGISVLVIDTQHSPEPRLVLTGDTLFIGDVGRPDLVGSRGYSATDMANMLYDSLHGKLLTLGDEVEVYPAHGAGSLCGRNISRERMSTIGAQRRENHALQAIDRDAFVSLVTSDLPEVPGYFPFAVEVNRAGAAPLADRPLPLLRPDAVRGLLQEGAILLDVRDAASFGAGHVPESVNIGLSGQFASWAGTLLPAAARLVVVAPGAAEAGEAAQRLARVGLENIAGWLDVVAWQDAGEAMNGLEQLSVGRLHQWQQEGRPVAVLDVRRPGERAAGFVPGSVNIPLDRLERELASVPAGRPLAVVCAGGYRSSVAASLLARHGLGELCNVVGGTSAWLAAGLPVDAPALV